MIVSLAIGFVMAVSAVVSPQGVSRIAAVSDMSSLLKGRTTAAVNFVVSHYLLGDSVLRTAGAVFRWRLFHAGNADVLVGDGDWLYYTGEFRAIPSAAANMAARADILAAAAAKLHEQGIDLLVAVIPAKLRVEADFLRVPIPSKIRDRLAIWTGLLRQHKLRIVDLNAVFAAQPEHAGLWLRTDSHWSQAGAALAAATIAGHVTTPINRQHVFKTKPEIAETRAGGDLILAMGLADVPDDLLIKLRPGNEYQHTEHTQEVMSGDRPAGLLDEGPPAQVVLLGTSFSRRGNFGGRLQEALGAPVINMGAEAGGFARSAQQYFSGSNFKQWPPALVIWEIPERVVDQPLVDEDTLLAEWAAQ